MMMKIIITMIIIAVTQSIFKPPLFGHWIKLRFILNNGLIMLVGTKEDTLYYCLRDQAIELEKSSSGIIFSGFKNPSPPPPLSFKNASPPLPSTLKNPSPPLPLVKEIHWVFIFIKYIIWHMKYYFHFLPTLSTSILSLTFCAYICSLTCDKRSFDNKKAPWKKVRPPFHPPWKVLCPPLHPPSKMSCPPANAEHVYASSIAWSLTTVQNQLKEIQVNKLFEEAQMRRTKTQEELQLMVGEALGMKTHIWICLFILLSIVETSCLNFGDMFFFLWVLMV